MWLAPDRRSRTVGARKKIAASLAPCALAAACALGPACSDATLVLLDPPLTLGSGRLLLEVVDGGRTVRLTRDGATTLTLDASAFQLGVVVDPSPERSWDPWDVERRGEAASGVTFRSPIAWSSRSVAPATEAAIDLDYGDGLGAKVALAAASPSRFTLTLVPGETRPGSPAVALARVRVRTNGDAREGFYGLGGQLDSVDNRGKLRAMQLEQDPELESGYNEAHAPVPLLVGTTGWGMFVPSKRVGVFDVARKDPSVVEATFAVAALADPRAEQLRVDLFLADAPLDLYREYYAASGVPRLPPPWAMGPWVWRHQAGDQAEVEGDLRRLRELDLATSGIWIERAHARAVGSFEFDPSRFPDPRRMIDRVHAAGFRLALWSAPYLETAAEPMAREASERGYFPVTAGALLSEWGPPFDFTSPGASAFWSGLVRRHTEAGVDGFKLDLGEDPAVASLGERRNVWRFSDGSDERTTQQRYSGLYHRVYFDTAIGREPSMPVPPNPAVPFLLVRSARYGEQTLGLVVWPPEMDATFTRHRERFVGPDGREVVGVGGLPATVVMGLSLSASGFPFFAADTGGFRHGPADDELFARWVEQTALSSVMQLGAAAGRLPWAAAEEGGRGAEALDVYRTYARLHARLFPYAWTYALRIVADGRPLQRPLGLAYPELGVHPDDEYLFGDDLLVAPVLAPGRTRRRLTLPEGRWFDYWDGAPWSRDERGEVEVDAPLGKLPLFLREGAIVPMLRPTIDTLSEAADEGVESFARDPGALWVTIAPGPPRAFDVFDGARIARTADATFEVASGAVFDRGFVLESIATAEPTIVTRDGAALARVATPEDLTTAPSGWTWTPARGGTLVVKLPPGAARVDVR